EKILNHVCSIGSSTRCFFPLIERRQAFSSKLGICRSFIPRYSGDGMLRFVFGIFLARPFAWSRQAGAINELLHLLFPGRWFAVLNYWIFPKLLAEITAGTNELLVILVRDFVFIDEEPIELRRVIGRAAPRSEAINAARDVSHVRRGLIRRVQCQLQSNGRRK